jgi:endonuclease III related protein
MLQSDMPLHTPDSPAPSRAGEDRALPPKQIERFYTLLNGELGPLGWWPGKTRFEVIVGAILTQSTAWSNVERAIGNLRREGLLHPEAMLRVRIGRLERLVRPSGYYRQKARKLKAFARFLNREFGGSLDRMFRQPTALLREKLLGVDGIGPETADSILLYAGRHPIFVIDAYTRRIFSRHQLLDEEAGYDEAQEFFHRYLPREVPLFNQYHALLVETGKRWCRPSQPKCQECPLGPLLERAL